jgi:hypothetical protein
MQTIQRTSKNKQYTEQQKIHRTTQKLGRVRAVFGGFILAFALQLRKKQGKTSVRVVIHNNNDNNNNTFKLTEPFLTTNQTL